MPSTSNINVPLVLVLSILAVLFVKTYGHGMMCSPRQRGAYHSSKCGSNLPQPKNPVIDYCAHCLNGGTVAKTKQNLPSGGWKNYEPTKDFSGTAGRAGLCGDAKGDNAHMLGGTFVPYDAVPLVSTYKSGGTIDFTVEIDTNHNGYFEFYLCNLDACGTSDVEPKCFTGGHCHQLQRVKHNDCEDPNVNTNFDCGPVDKAYPGRWYVPCRKTGHVGVHIVGGSSGTMRYKLPEGVECKHCVIQWYWGTANSCAPRGFLDFFINYNNPFGSTCDSDGGGRGAHRPGMTECEGNLVPEEFWSCSDVRITNDGSTSDDINSVQVQTPGSNSTDPNSGPEVVQDSPDDSFVGENEDVNINDDNEMDKDEVESGEATVDNESCILEHDACDGTVPCCNPKQVCVYTKATSSFSCRFWWKLWEEVQS